MKVQILLRMLNKIAENRANFKIFNIIKIISVD